MKVYRAITLFVAATIIIVATCGAKSWTVRVKTFPDGSRMIKIPAGNFIMGDNAGEADERPQRQVKAPTFWIDKTEVTYSLYEQCISQGKCRAPENYGDITDKNRPVVGVSWQDAADYCSWAQERLPTEAEWEKSARGEDGRSYPWGRNIGCNRANYRECGIGRTVTVGSYPAGASPYILMDMSGNAWEWVADYYDPDYYKNAPSVNPKGPDDGKYRVARGGSWNRPAAGLRSADRAAFKPSKKSDDIGFRCARDD